MHRLSTAAVLVLLISSVAGAAPRWRRLSWTGPTDTTLTVSWTDDAVGAGQAEVRAPGGAARTVTATATATGSTELDVTYVARVTGLTPDSAWEYRVQSGGAWSDWQPFRTAPSPGSCAPVKLVATGDSRGQELPVLGYQPSGQWDDVAAAMARENPLAAFHTGDYVYDGAKEAQWPKELPLLEPLSRRVPFFLSLGNHDDGPGLGAGASFNRLFETPANGPDGVDDYFSLVLGNVLVVNLSTQTYSMDTQLAWLRTVLEATRTTVDWRVITFHVPVWSSGAHGINENDAPRAAVLVPMLDEFGVDLVFNGHDHDYERFHPSRGGFGGVARVVTPLPLANGTEGVAAGTIYAVTGGGGALVNPVFAATVAGHARDSNKLHYVVLEAQGGTLTMTTRDCGTQGLGPATCAGSLEVLTLRKATTQCGAVPDAGTPVLDAGSAPVVDAGPGTFDAGSAPVVDAGAAGDADAGTPTFDAGPPPSPGVDAGPAGGTMAPEPTAVPGGCGCSGAGGAAAVLGVALLLTLRRVRAA